MKKDLLKILLAGGWLFMSFLVGNLAIAQEPHYRNFTVRDGLPSMTIYRGLQGSDGRIWLATENGLSAFDGFEFQNWHLESGLPDSEVTELTEDSEGRIWFCCLNGHIGYLEGETIHSSANTDWIPRFGRVPTIFGLLGDGRIAVGDPTLVLYLSPETVDTVFSGHSSASRSVIDLDKDGVWLVSSEGQPICQKPSDSLTAPFEFLKGLPCNWNLHRSSGSIRFFNRAALERIKRDSSFLSQTIFNTNHQGPLVNHFSYGPANDCWVGSYSSGFWKLTSEAEEPQKILAEASVAEIFFDRSGNQWVLSMGKGLFLFPKATQAVRNYSQHMGICSGEAHCLARSPSRKILVGHDDLELSVAGSNVPIQLSRFLSRGRVRIRDLEFLPSGHLLVATDQNMMVLPPDFLERDPEQVEPVPLANPGIGRLVEGSTRLKPGNYYVVPKPMAMKDIEIIDSTTWVCATAGGVVKFHIEDDVVHFKFITQARAWALAYSPGEDLLWVGAKEALYTYKNDSLVAHPIDLQSRPLSLDLDETGALWISTSGQGLFRVQGDSWEQLGRKAGLPSQTCTSLAIESPTQLWVGTDIGIVRVHLKSLSPLQIDRHSTIGYEQGLPNCYINDLRLLDKELWAATAEGVSAFDLDKLGQGAGIPCLDIDKVLVHGQKQSVQDRYDLPHNLNSLTFHLWDPCFTANQFQYRIPEKDSQWVALPGNIADFPYLGEGDQYHLEFRSLNPQEIASGIKSVYVSIGIPFYRSNWFLLGICGLAYGGLLLFLHLRSRNAAKEREKQAAFLQRLSQMRFSALKSQMNPHFLFNSLHSIQELVRSEDGEATHVYISRFAMLMRRILDHSLEDFVSIAKELEVTQLYLDLEYLRHQKCIEMEIATDPQLDTKDLWMPAFVLQPFIENAIWHGLLAKEGKRKLRVQVQGLEKEVLFVIEDNGIGRSAAAMCQSKHPDSASLSTQNFAERMHILNHAFGEWAFSYQYVDLKGENGNPAGTRLEIRIPYLHQPPQPYRVV